MNEDKARALVKDIRRSLEDIQTKLNSIPPQQMYDDLIPIIEDLDILETACGPAGTNGSNEPVTNKPNTFPQFQQGPVGNMSGIMDEMWKMVQGANGPSQQEAEDIDPQLSVLLLHDNLIRLEERIKVGEMLGGMNGSPEQTVNSLQIRTYMSQLRYISEYLAELVMNIEEIEDPDEEE